MNNVLTVVKTQIGMFAGIQTPWIETTTNNPIHLKDPVTIEVMPVPAPGALQGSVSFIPQWICYSLHTPKMEIALDGLFAVFELPLDKDNVIVNLYKRATQQANKKPSSLIH